MWTRLEAVHQQKRPGARFNAYDTLFSIRKKEDESLQSMVARVQDAMLQIKNLREPTFILANLDNKRSQLSTRTLSLA